MTIIKVPVLESAMKLPYLVEPSFTAPPIDVSMCTANPFEVDPALLEARLVSQLPTPPAPFEKIS